MSMRIERRKGVIRGEAIVGGNQKLTRGRFVVEFFCLVPVLVGPFLNQLGFVGVQEGFFSEEGPKNTLVWKQHPLWRKAQITASAVIRLSSRVL